MSEARLSAVRDEIMRLKAANADMQRTIERLLKQTPHEQDAPRRSARVHNKRTAHVPRAPKARKRRCATPMKTEKLHAVPLEQRVRAGERVTATRTEADGQVWICTHYTNEKGYYVTEERWDRPPTD